MSKQSIILKRNGQYDFSSAFETVNELPVDNFTLKLGSFGRIYLEEEKALPIPEKIYSNDKSFISHVVRSFNTGVNDMGILLTGKKGLGKTLTSKVICKELNLPIIHIKENFGDADIFSFLNQIDQDYILFIDEFEKIFPYNSHSNGDEHKAVQNNFLAFLDGNNTSSSNSKKLFLITSNEGISHYFLNRPSRLRYVRNYNSISEEVIKEIVNDLMVNPEFKEDLFNNLDVEELNIDTLIKVIEEINLMSVPYSEFKDFFNFQTNKDRFDVFRINVDNSMTHINVIHRSETSLRALFKPKVALFYDDDKNEYVNFVSMIEETFNSYTLNASYIENSGEDDEQVKNIKLYLKRDFKPLGDVF